LSYGVRAFDRAADAARVREIWSCSLRNLEACDSLEARSRWLYEQNPSGPVQTSLGVHAESSETIGCGSLVPCALHLGGNSDDSIQAGILSDLAVVAKHRTAGPAVKILRAVAKRGIESGYDVLYGAPNPKSNPIFKRIRFRLVGEVSSWVKPLQSVRNVSQFAPSPAVAKVAAFFVDRALQAYDWSMQIGDMRWHRGALADRPDERYDALWQRAPSHLVTVAKTRSYLDWRYGRYTTRTYRFFEMSDLRGELRGWVSFAVKEGTVLVGDLHCDLEPDLERLLFAFAERMRAEGYRAIGIDYLGNERLKRALVAQHYFPREADNRPLFIRLGPNVPPEIADRLGHPNNWMLLEGGLDI
jgi:hypothetical protein